MVLIEAKLMSGERTIYPFSEDDLFDVDDRIFTGSQLLSPIYEKPVNKFVPEDFEDEQMFIMELRKFIKRVQLNRVYMNGKILDLKTPKWEPLPD